MVQGLVNHSGGMKDDERESSHHWGRSRLFKSPLKGASKHWVSASLGPQQKYDHDSDNDTRYHLDSCPVHDISPELGTYHGVVLAEDEWNGDFATVSLLTLRLSRIPSLRF